MDISFLVKPESVSISLSDIATVLDTPEHVLKGILFDNSYSMNDAEMVDGDTYISEDIACRLLRNIAIFAPNMKRLHALHDWMHAAFRKLEAKEDDAESQETERLLKELFDSISEILECRKQKEAKV